MCWFKNPKMVLLLHLILLAFPLSLTQQLKATGSDSSSQLDLVRTHNVYLALASYYLPCFQPSHAEADVNEWEEEASEVPVLGRKFGSSWSFLSYCIMPPMHRALFKLTSLFPSHWQPAGLVQQGRSQTHSGHDLAFWYPTVALSPCRGRQHGFFVTAML